jgi:putative aldouronate transport system permease protein
MVKPNKLTNKPGLFDVINLIFLIFVCITTLYPFYNLFITSISTMQDVIRNNGVMLIPKTINLEAYKYMMHYAGLSQAFKVTIFVTIVGTTVNLIMTSLGAYVLSAKEMPGRNFLMTIVLITMFFGGGMIPTYIVIKNLNLIDNIWVMIIPSAIGTWNLILLRNFFQGIPASLKESARIDGASEITILIKIMLPLSLPIIATLALFYGVGHWNQYMGAILYINKPKLQPLQVLIRNMFNTGVQELNPGDTLPPPTETLRSAAVMIATVPILVIYPLLQKYFVQGMMVGSLKG